MNLRPAAGIALLMFGLSLVLPALRFYSSSFASSGWETVIFSGTMSIDLLIHPSDLQGLLLGGAAVSDRLLASASLSGTGANLLLLFAVGCAIRRRCTATLIAGAAALSSAAMCFVILMSDQGVQPMIGIGLWIGSMLWLSSAAAWEVWRMEFGGRRFDAALSR